MQEFFFVEDHLLAAAAHDVVLGREFDRVDRAGFFAHAAVDAAELVDLEFLRVFFPVIPRALFSRDVDAVGWADGRAHHARHAFHAAVFVPVEPVNAAEVGLVHPAFEDGLVLTPLLGVLDHAAGLFLTEPALPEACEKMSERGPKAFDHLWEIQALRTGHGRGFDMDDVLVADGHSDRVYVPLAGIACFMLGFVFCFVLGYQVGLWRALSLGSELGPELESGVEIGEAPECQGNRAAGFDIFCVFGVLESSSPREHRGLYNVCMAGRGAAPLFDLLKPDSPGRRARPPESDAAGDPTGKAAGNSAGNSIGDSATDSAVHSTVDSTGQPLPHFGGGAGRQAPQGDGRHDVNRGSQPSGMPSGTFGETPGEMPGQSILGQTRRQALERRGQRLSDLLHARVILVPTVMVWLGIAALVVVGVAGYVFGVMAGERQTHADYEAQAARYAQPGGVSATGGTLNGDPASGQAGPDFNNPTPENSAPNDPAETGFDSNQGGAGGEPGEGQAKESAGGPAGEQAKESGENLEAGAKYYVIGQSGWTPDPRQDAVNYYQLPEVSFEDAQYAINFFAVNGIDLIAIPRHPKRLDRPDVGDNSLGPYRLVSVAVVVPSGQRRAMATEVAAHERDVRRVVRLLRADGGLNIDSTFFWDRHEAVSPR